MLLSQGKWVHWKRLPNSILEFLLLEDCYTLPTRYIHSSTLRTPRCYRPLRHLQIYELKIASIPRCSNSRFRPSSKSNPRRIDVDRECLFIYPVALFTHSRCSRFPTGHMRVPSMKLACHLRRGLSAHPGWDWPSECGFRVGTSSTGCECSQWSIVDRW